MTMTTRICAALAVAALVCAASEAQARPNYRTALNTKYADAFKAAGTKVTCFACHGKTAEGKMDKETRNAYGKVLGKAIGKKNEKDKTKLDEALGKVESEKSSVEGKTYGDLLKAGKLPVPEEE